MRMRVTAVCGAASAKVRVAVHNQTRDRGTHGGSRHRLSVRVGRENRERSKHGNIGDLYLNTSLTSVCREFVTEKGK